MQLAVWVQSSYIFSLIGTLCFTLFTHKYTLNSTLRPDTQHAVKAKVIVLANDPLHTPYI